MRKLILSLMTFSLISTIYNIFALETKAKKQEPNSLTSIVSYWNTTIVNASEYRLKNLIHTKDEKGYLTSIDPESINNHETKENAYSFSTNYFGQISQEIKIDVVDENNHIVGFCILHSGIGSYMSNPDFTGSYCSDGLNLNINPQYYIDDKSITQASYEVTYIISKEKYISRLFIFGDSLSDTGNTYKLDMGTVPISPPYFKGHFTNHLVWHEYFIKKAKLPEHAVYNYAFGGARALQNIIPIPSLDKQVNTYLLWNPTADPICFIFYLDWRQ